MDLQQKNKKVMGITLGVAFSMVLLSFAAVPLYRTLCQVTGWGGTTQKTEKNAGIVASRIMTVQFNADVAPDMPWDFHPDLRQVSVKIGQDAIISYTAKNTSSLPVAGTAVFNVTPLRAGKYFNKTQCFCFGEQLLSPGQKVRMPVTFFIDPRIMDDPDLKDLGTITLSYTFYRHDSPALEKALEKFYNAKDTI